MSGGEESEPISKFRNSCAFLPLSLRAAADRTCAVGFLNQKVAPMTSMAFHPHHMVLGCSSADGHINTFEMGASRRSTSPLVRTDAVL